MGCLCTQVGAQNAGKSSLINAMRRAVGHRRPQEELTTAALPGTTLGVFPAQQTATIAVAKSWPALFCSFFYRSEACQFHRNITCSLFGGPAPCSVRTPCDSTGCQCARQCMAMITLLLPRCPLLSSLSAMMTCRCRHAEGSRLDASKVQDV